MSTSNHIPPPAATGNDASKHNPWIRSGRGSKADSSPHAHIAKLVGSMASAMANCFQDQRRCGLTSVMTAPRGGLGFSYRNIASAAATAKIISKIAASDHCRLNGFDTGLLKIISISYPTGGPFSWRDFRRRNRQITSCVIATAGTPQTPNRQRTSLRRGECE
jgi:hypothetical protein